MPAAKKAGAIVRQHIWIRKPFSSNGFECEIMRPAYPMTSATHPKATAIQKALFFVMMPWMTWRTPVMAKKVRKEALAAREG